MKTKLVIFTALALLLATGASAQDGMGYRHEVRLGIGGFPSVESFGLGESLWCSHFHEPDLQALYHDGSGRLWSTGTFAAEYDWLLSKRWSLGTILSANGLAQACYDGLSGEKTGVNYGVSASVMAQSKYYYCARPLVRVYSSIAIGAHCIGFAGDADFFLCCQFNPVGVSVGRKWAGFAQFGLGNLYFGGMIGVSRRF